MYPHSFLWHFLWLAPRALQTVIAVIMIRRGLARSFPVFFAYTVFQIIAETTLFVFDHSAAVSGDLYWAAVWMVLPISCGLRFGIIWEVFAGVFNNYPALRQLNHLFFRWAIVLLFFLAIAIAARIPEDGMSPVHSHLYALDISVNLIQSGLWLLLLVFSAYFGLSWRTFAYGIASGLGVYSTVAFAAEVKRVWTGFVAGYAFDFVTMATYNCCVAIWLVYLLLPEKSWRTLKELPENNLEQWNAELQRLLTQ